MSNALISHYTQAVLQFSFNEEPSPCPLQDCSTEEIEQFTHLTLKLFTKSGATYLILFGLGTGAHALALAAGLPDNTCLVISETNLSSARSFLRDHPEWNTPESNTFIITDTSLWAHFYLLIVSGITTENSHTVLNPELKDETKNKYQSLQRRFVSARSHQAINSSYLSHVAVQAPDLSVGTILSPDEPGLDTYFKQFPDWVKEIVVIWDSEEIPETNYSCPVPIKHFAHPLQNFADQRNKMVQECGGEWILYLDGDEMFSEDTWALFTALMLIKRLEACYFPRMTLYPNESSNKIGFGLWPDLQLRLFKNNGDISFDRPIHEKLNGINGRVALAVDAPILHYSRIRKSLEELSAKLKRFDTTGHTNIQHMLNDEYPHLERSYFPEASFIMGALQVMLLEENPA